MLDRAISILVLSPRNAKVSPARLTRVAKALSFGREEAFLFPERLWVLWGREQNESLILTSHHEERWCVYPQSKLCVFFQGQEGGKVKSQD